MTIGIDTHCANCGRIKAQYAHESKSTISGYGFVLPLTSSFGDFEGPTHVGSVLGYSSTALTTIKEPHTIILIDQNTIPDSVPSSQASPIKHGPPRHWYCCECGDGPKNPQVEIICVNCGHRLCRTCTAK